MYQRNIPSSNEQLTVIGLGTWQTFDVGGNSANENLKKVLQTLHASGGRLIDSSPMYGKAEQVIGEITSTMNERDDFFYATKVWTTGLQSGIEQLESSMKKMKRKIMDLVQIHNLVDWKRHLPQLRKMKDAGSIRYLGITHYTDSAHEELERIMRSEKIDFVQFNYSIADRHAEQRLLPGMAELGVATIINRPFGEGDLFRQVHNKPLPLWAKEYDIESWSAYFLKYIIAHPAVTAVIPATGNPAHEVENVKAGIGKLPDETGRKRMVDYLNSL